MHEDHRERLRKRFLKEGLDGFEAHNVLELLLFFSIPRRDVNELAHTLIDRFGSVHGVFDASFEELCSVPGIGEYSATLLKLIPELSRVYSTEKNNPKMILGSEDAAGRFLVDIYRGITVETVYLILLGNKCDIIDCVRL